MGKSESKMRKKAFNPSRRRQKSRSSKPLSWLERLQLVREFIRNFQWIHIGLGLLGNFAFFIGSICFLWETLKIVGIWLFIVGSLGMLIGSIGSAIVKLEK